MTAIRLPRRLRSAALALSLAAASLATLAKDIALSTLYAQNGWIGPFLPFKVSFTPLGVFVALTFIGLPFVVRTVQPVLENLRQEFDEAAATLGANRWQTFTKVIFPIVVLAFLTFFLFIPLAIVFVEALKWGWAVHPATPFLLQFLGDVNLFNGRAGATGHGPGGAVAGDLHCVRPHELDMVADAAADDDTWGADLAQMLTLGPVTRLEFRRADGSDVDVELPRERWMQLRTALQLAPGARARLKPRRITRFTSAADTPLESNPTAVG